MLEQLASKLLDEGKIKKLFVKAEFNFSFQGLGMSLKGEIPISNVSNLLKKEIEYLKRKDIKVLITVDEILTNKYTKVFAHEFQSFFILKLFNQATNQINL